MTDEKAKYNIPPGTYTSKTLPPISPEAQEILDRVYAAADKWEASPEGKATRARAEKAREKGDMVAFIGIMLGADGYK